MPFPGDTAYSSELVKFSRDCKGLLRHDAVKAARHAAADSCLPALAGSQAATDAALRILHSCFGMSRTAIHTHAP